MLNSFSGRVSGALLISASVLVSGSVVAQESLQMTGPLNVIGVLPAGTSVPPYNFAATIQFDPDVPPGISSLSAGDMEEAYFTNAINFIEYSIFDSLGTQIVHALLTGNTLNELHAVNDLSGSGNDMISYRMTQSDPVSMDDVLFRFADSSGLLVTDVDSVPAAPVIGSFSNSLVLLNFLGSDSLYLGSGQVTFISAGESSPFDECADQARNHGQYVRCVSQLNNLLRANGEMTGHEKGQAQKEAAQKPR